jgi:hypothetical protein
MQPINERLIAQSGESVDAWPPLRPFERREFPMTHVIASKRLADLYATSSDVASLPRAARTHLVDRVRELSDRLPEKLRLPGRTVVDLCHRN